MGDLLTIRDLGVRFGSFQAVSSLSFSIRPANVVALVGESGCGKSLTAASIMGLLPSNAEVSGDILFDGQDFLRLAARQKRAVLGSTISMIFQDPMTSLNPMMTIGEQIAEAIRLHRPMTRAAVHKRAVELLDLVAIREPHRIADEYPHRLSGGMRQRAMIAMAVSLGPKLLIADEPTTALDATVQAQIFKLLMQLKNELSMAILLITHDIGVVSDWADSVVVMYAGCNVEKAGARGLLDTPQHPYTRGLLGASLINQQDLHYSSTRLSEIPGNVASAIDASGCKFAPRCAEALAICRRERPAPTAFSASHEFSCFARATELGR